MPDIETSAPEAPGAIPAQQDAGRLLRLASAASLSMAALLSAAKLGGWLASGSVSLLASLLDSAMDVAASLLNFVAIRYALMPADADHRFGHGKAESLAGLGQATFVAGSAVFVILHAIDRMLHPEPLRHLGVAFAVMIAATIVTLALIAFQRYVIARTGSTAIRADSLHYSSDLLTNLGILVALGLASIGIGGADPLLAIAVAAYIFYGAWRIGREAVQMLMDRELPEEIASHIAALARSEPGVHGVHDLRTRQSGLAYIVQLHLELDDDLPLVRAHAIADAVERRIVAAYPNADVIIHQDPVSVVSKEHSGGSTDAPRNP